MTVRRPAEAVLNVGSSSSSSSSSPQHHKLVPTSFPRTTAECLLLRTDLRVGPGQRQVRLEEGTLAQRRGVGPTAECRRGEGPVAQGPLLGPGRLGLRYLVMVVGVVVVVVVQVVVVGGGRSVAAPLVVVVGGGVVGVGVVVEVVGVVQSRVPHAV